MSSAKIKIIANVFIPSMVVLDCGKKGLGLARFVDKQEKHSGGRHAAIAFATLPAASCRNSSLLGDRLAGPGDLDFDGAAKATSRMRHDVSFALSN